MHIQSASFVVSNSKRTSCPQDGLQEYAFIGRSNVGKSSLINMLTNVKDLAKTSSKPGKTLLINHFLVNQEWYIVDLPGYGYAKISKSMRESVHKMITDYVTKREQLACLFVLLDSRHEPQEIDMEFLEFLGENGVPFAIIFTKTDKVSQAEVGKNIRKFKEKMLQTWEELPAIFQTSSKKNRGREEVLNYIESIIQTIREND
ncbi:MAG TPA: ribosome biogenesis GTP-binding protein YihA/YsxC [Bacteroidales bacterium]|nr:ribosome biogenesis GTP-binding protein YihA/YsxC [Bacteroidales bacterium]